MAEVNKTFKYSQTSKIGKFIFLFIVIFLTISVAFYNSYLEKEITKLETQVEEHKAEVKKLESQKKVYVYSLILLHKSILKKMDERSHITKYIDHLDTMKEHYNLEMR
jgi:hypothetical protein